MMKHLCTKNVKKPLSEGARENFPEARERVVLEERATQEELQPLVEESSLLPIGARCRKGQEVHIVESHFPHPLQHRWTVSPCWTPAGSQRAT